MSHSEVRERVLRAHGADDQDTRTLLEYGANRFATGADTLDLPLTDEPFIPAWEGYARDAEASSVWECLRQVFMQAAFPIAEGISETDAYRAATRRGERPAGGSVDGGLLLDEPARLRLFLHPTAAGRIPILVTGCRADFVALLRALTRRNEPYPIPDSMGACVVGGYNNWERVGRYRHDWETATADRDRGSWEEEWRAVIPRKSLYQDRFILLSDGPYSGVSATDLGLETDEWASISLQIRLEHECCHYVTRRIFGSMSNSLHDELMADYCGVRSAAGRFRADWFLRFMGLEDFPAYRDAGRLENYRGTPPLRESAFAVLRSVVRSAALGLEELDRCGATGGDSLAERVRTLRALAKVSVEELASDSAYEAFTAAREQPPPRPRPGLRRDHRMMPIPRH